VVQPSPAQLDDSSLVDLILDSAVDFGIICTDLDGRVSIWSEGARRIFGYEATEMVGHDAAIVFTPEDIESGRPRAEMDEALSHGRASDERWHRRKDGSRFWASGALMPLKKSDGPARGFIKIVRDLTEQRRAVEAVKFSEERFHTVLENLPHKVWFLPVGDDVPFVNRGWREYTGLTPETGKRWPELLHPDDFEAQMASRRQALAAGEAYELRTRIRRADGVYRWQLARMVPLREAGGQLFAWLGSWTDIEDIVATEAALAEALQRQQLLTREASHRVKNSLQIIGSLLALQVRGAKDPQLQGALNEARGRISTIAQVHDRFWRQHDASLVDVNAILQDLCGDLARHAPACRLSYEGAPVTGAADLAIPLGLVVNELVTNAFKYACDGGGEVRVRLVANGDGSMRLIVSDQGPGFPEGVDLQGSRSLGMKIVSSFVGQLGGTVEMSSGSSGTTFVIELPSRTEERAE
jgi:PAS domain S-box-containing protein